MGEDALARQLDQFLIKSPLTNQLAHIRQWVGSGGCSNHSPIFLEIEDANLKPGSPFKFNATWLSEQDFHVLVKDCWTHYSRELGLPSTIVISHILTHLKGKTISWIKAKLKRDKEELVRIETELKHLKSLGLNNYASLQSKDHLINLEKERIRLLRRTEETWHLKSRALWLKSGDENTNFSNSLPGAGKRLIQSGN